MIASPPSLAGAVQERSIRVVPLGVAERPVGAPGAVAVLTGGAVLTWKTSESPYMGRVALPPALELEERGPWLLPEELGRPTVVGFGPSACELLMMNDSVPSWSQPVKGKLAALEVSGPSVPDSFLSLTSSSQSPS